MQPLSNDLITQILALPSSPNNLLMTDSVPAASEKGKRSQEISVFRVRASTKCCSILERDFGHSSKEGTVFL